MAALALAHLVRKSNGLAPFQRFLECSAAAGYDLDYPPYRIPTNHEQLAQAAEAFRWRADFVREFAQRGRMLELGPSYSVELFAFRNYRRLISRPARIYTSSLYATVH